MVWRHRRRGRPSSTWLNASGIFTLSLEQVVTATGVLILGLVVAYFAIALLFGGFTTAEQKRLVVIFFLFIGAALFWSGFEQAGSSLNLFAADYTDRVIFGWEAPASWLQSRQPDLHHRLRTRLRVALAGPGQMESLPPLEVRLRADPPGPGLPGHGLGRRLCHPHRGREPHVAGGDLLPPHRRVSSA